MKKFLGKSRQTMRNNWKNVMQSGCIKMSCGAQYIDKMISWARGENWRGKRKNKK